MAGIGDTRLEDDITAFSTAMRDAAAVEYEGEKNCGGVRSWRRWGKEPGDNGDVVFVGLESRQEWRLARRCSNGLVW